MSRIILRALMAGDESTINAWLPEAVGAVEGSRAPRIDATLEQFQSRLDPTEDVVVVELKAERRPVGLVVLEDGAEASPQLRFLAIAGPDRNLGLGAEAVYALERRLNPGPLYVRIPRENGWSIYFWLRIGYRPWYPRAGVLDQPDAFWMLR